MPPLPRAFLWLLESGPCFHVRVDSEAPLPGESPPSILGLVFCWAVGRFLSELQETLQTSSSSLVSCIRYHTFFSRVFYFEVKPIYLVLYGLGGVEGVFKKPSLPWGHILISFSLQCYRIFLNVKSLNYLEFIFVRYKVRIQVFIFPYAETVTPASLLGVFLFPGGWWFSVRPPLPHICRSVWALFWFSASSGFPSHWHPQLLSLCSWVPCRVSTSILCTC